MNNSNEKSGKKPYVQPAITAVINLKEKYGINDMGMGGGSQQINANSDYNDTEGGSGAAAPKSDLIFGDDAESVTKTSTHSVWDDTGVWDDDISMK